MRKFVLGAALAAVAMPVAPVFADPPHWAPAHGRRAKEHRAKIAAEKPRDQVETGGGIVGKVTRVVDDFADVEIAQGVKIKVVKSTLADVLEPGTKPAND